MHGIDAENQQNIDEVINILREEMLEKITRPDVDISHPLGNLKPDKSQPRPIFIKFLRYNVRAKIFKNKRKLKGK